MRFLDIPEYVPQVYFNNFVIGAPPLITFQPDNTYTVSDGFSKVVGRHTLKLGGEFRYLQVNERNLASQDGAFIFDGTVTGNDFADYLIGATYGRRKWVHAGSVTTPGFAHALWRCVCARPMEGNPQPDAKPRSPLGSEHALV